MFLPDPVVGLPGPAVGPGGPIKVQKSCTRFIFSSSLMSAPGPYKGLPETSRIYPEPNPKSWMFRRAPAQSGTRNPWIRPEPGPFRPLPGRPAGEDLKSDDHPHNPKFTYMVFGHQKHEMFAGCRGDTGPPKPWRRLRRSRRSHEITINTSPMSTALAQI